MKKIASFILCIFFFCPSVLAGVGDSSYYKGSNKRINYIGRFDLSEKDAPKCWASGAYFEISFKGTYCIAIIDDELKWNIVHNYIEIVIDDTITRRIQLKYKNNRLILAENLSQGNHRITVVKNSEAENGYLQIRGIICTKLLTPAKKKKRKIEFIGDSITCGAASDESEIPCGKGNWHDQHNAWLAYGPRTARTLTAQWQLSSVSGIGLIHSCCNKKIVMPDVYDKINMADDTLQWNFNRYQPNVVSICLGENDGIQDSVKFCNAYIKFAKRLRQVYPNSTLVFLTSPMANPWLKKALSNYLLSVEQYFLSKGDKRVGVFVFANRYTNGCGSHPSVEEHGAIAKELSAYLRKKMNWK